MIGKKTLFEFFKTSPTPSLLLQIDSPKFTIAHVNDAFLEATHLQREDLIGKGIFEVFPANDSDNATDSDINLTLSSLDTVLKTHKKHQMTIQKYDIPIRGTSEFELKYWESENIPLFDDDGKLNLIAHCSRDVTKQIITEKQFKEFEYFFKNSNDFSCIANTEGYFEITNSSFNKVLGYSLNELATKPFIDFVHPDDIPATLEAYDQLKSGATVIHFINRYRKKDGNYLWFDWNATPNPVTGKLYCIARDFTERKIAEDEITKANKRFSSIFNFSPVAISITNPSDGRFIQVNDAFCETTGYDRESLIGKKSVDVKIIDAELRDKLISQIMNQGNKRKDIEGTLKKPNGEIVEVLYRVEKIEIDSQTCFVSALIDITERKKTEEELEQRVKQRTEDVVQALKENNIILESIGDAFFAVDNQWTVTYWNRIAERDLSVLKKDIVGKNLWDIFSDSIDSKSYRKYHEAVATNQVVHFEDYYYALNKWYEISAYPSENGLSVYFKDVTESKKAKELIKKSNERFEYVSKATFDAIWDWDLTVDKIYWGEGFEKIFGYNLTELKDDSHAWMKNIHPDDLEKITQSYYDTVKSNAINWIEEYRFKKSNGQYAYIINKGIVIRDTSGRATRIIGAMQDITKRKQEEVRLKLLESVITNTDDSVIITEAEPFDEPGPRIVYVNEAFTRMTGYTAEEVIGKTPRILQGPKTDREELNKLGAALRQWQPYEVTLLNYKKNGEEFWIHMSINPVADANGWFTHFVAIERDVTQQKREEERLKLLESVITNTNDAVVIKEAKPSSELGRKIVYVNESFTRMSGYTSDEIIGRTHQLLQGPNTNPAELTRFYKALDAWQPCEVTIINYNKNGQEYWVNLSLNPVTNSKGEYTHWISIERDVTEKKVFEAELLKRLKEITDYKYAIDESSIVAITNQKGIITHVNTNFCKISKYSSEELLGQDHRIVNSGYHPKEYIKQLWTTIAKGKVWKGELKNKAKDGTPYWVDTTIVPFLNEDGKPYQYVAIRSDITERKIQEQKIKDTTQRLSDTLESIQDGFYTLDSDWNISYWNKEAEKISGRTQEEMMGKNFWELYHGRISEKINTTFHKVKSNNKSIRFEVYSKQSKYWFELNAFPSELGLTVYFKNITERKQTESKLKKINRTLENHVKELAVSNQELEQFAYVASHDLQEPLRMITSFLTQIEKKYEDVLDEKGKKYIFFAVDGAKRMRQIILDLLEFSRIGKNENRHEQVDLNSIVEEIILLYRKQIEEKKAIINYETLPILHSYAAPLRQVFQNLISNSLKYSNPESAPSISIYCSESATLWKFEIKDNGIGINSEYYDKIFIIFQRLHSKEEYSGTGMGLAITKKIIENLRGQIWVKSEEGKGTSFYFTIPKK
jgi:PAS domain S-box-containing protein